MFHLSAGEDCISCTESAFESAASGTVPGKMVRRLYRAVGARGSQRRKVYSTVRRTSEQVPVCVCSKKQKSEEFAKILYNEIICRYSRMTSLLTDRGTNFCSALVSDLCKLMKVNA